MSIYRSNKLTPAVHTYSSKYGKFFTRLRRKICKITYIHISLYTYIHILLDIVIILFNYTYNYLKLIAILRWYLPVLDKFTKKYLIHMLIC